MKLVVWLHAVYTAASMLTARALFEEAKSALHQLPSKYHSVPPVYNQDNIESGIYIPQYNWETHEYEGYMSRHPQPTVEYRLLPQLDQASRAGIVEASVMLGDIYMFGNYSVGTNYSRARDYYEQAVVAEPNGHAYFMLGFIYSTGMFGEVVRDSERGNVYYEYAAQNDNLNALLVLANKYNHGIGRPQDCAVAQFYYSRAARVAMLYLDQSGAEPAYETVLKNIKLPDFNGGLYGSHITESDLTVVSKIDLYTATRNALRDGNFNTHDAEMADYYFDALLQYYGGYFMAQNTTAAFQDALTCAFLGEQKFGHRSVQLLSEIDRYLWSRCMSLVGHMYVKGHGVERDLNRAHTWMTRTAAVYSNYRDMLDRALLHQYDPTTEGFLSPQCIQWLENASLNRSSHAAYLYARYLTGSRHNPFDTTYDPKTYELLRKASNRGHYESLFYIADAVESGYSAAMGETFTCPDLVAYYKRFVERSESFLLPHLAYAFDEFTHGNYKGALLGYLMAAEQGVSNAQVSAAYLLFQRDPLFTWKPRTFAPERVQAAINYLELASLQGDVDATIFLGDLFLGSSQAANISVDYPKAFAYYNKAALSASPHGCYKLGYMYEYGMGSANNTVDYYMAKRYYDLSIKYRQDHDGLKSKKVLDRTYPLSIALLRLRLKLIWNNDKKDQPESSSWFGTFRNLKSMVMDDDDVDDIVEPTARAHHEGEAFDDEEDEYEMFDYVVLLFTFCFFIFLVIQNVQRHVRGMGGRNNPNANPNPNPNPDNGFHVQGRNFEFFFFAV